MSTTLEEPDLKIKQVTIPHYHVIVENDDVHSFSFVILVLIKVFALEQTRAVELTLQIHEEGRAIVWTGSREVAEFKVEQISTFTEANFGALKSYIEEA
jgi:ATP-dependent Clp protease adaptor protein ClpS